MAAVPTASSRGAAPGLALAALAIAVSACSLDSRRLAIRGAVPATERLPRDAAAADANAHVNPDAAAARDGGDDAGSARTRPDAEPPVSVLLADAARDATQPGLDAAIDAASDAGDAAVDSSCRRFEVDHGWVDDWTNCLEIQGAVWDQSENGGFNRAFYVSDPLCVEEYAPAREAAVLGINLNQAHAQAEPADYNADLHGVRGFHVRVSSGQLPGQPFPFVGVATAEGIYCMPLPEVGDHELRFADLHARCWEASPGPSPNTERLRALIFYYPAGWPGDTLAGCVGEFTAIVE